MYASHQDKQVLSEVPNIVKEMIEIFKDALGSYNLEMAQASRSFVQANYTLMHGALNLSLWSKVNDPVITEIYNTIFPKQHMNQPASLDESSLYLEFETGTLELPKLYKLLLAEESEWFHSLFYGNFRESRKSTIPLKDTSIDNFKRMLELVISGELNLDITKLDETVDIYEEARFLHMKSTMHKVNGILVEGIIAFCDQNDIQSLTYLISRAPVVMQEHEQAHKKFLSLYVRHLSDSYSDQINEVPETFLDGFRILDFTKDNSIQKIDFLKVAEKLKNIRVLRFSPPNNGFCVFEVARAWPEMRILELRSPYLGGDHTLLGVSNLKNLTELNLIDVRSLTRILELEKLTNLRILNLNSSIWLQALEGLNQLTNLESLSLSECTKLGNTWLYEFIGLTRLTFLDITSCTFSEEGMGKIGQLTGLTHLDVTSSSITDKSIENFGRLEKLKTFNAAFTEITAAKTVSILSRCLDLQTVDLSFHKKKDCLDLDGIFAPNIRSLNLDGYSGNRLLSAIPRIEKLCELTLGNASDLQLSFLKYCMTLEVLKIENARIEGNADAVIKDISTLPCLRILSLSRCPFLTNSAVEWLSNLHDTLEELNLSGCISRSDGYNSNKITSQSFDSLALLKKLKVLDISGIRSFTLYEIRKLARLQKLKELSYSKVHGEEDVQLAGNPNLLVRTTPY